MGKKILLGQIILLLLNFLFSNLNKLLTNPYLIVLISIGTVVGLSGLFFFDKKSFSIYPEPKDENKLTTNGIYNYIRHPMYTGLLIIGLTLLLTSVSTITIIIYIFLIAILDLKATYEESLLLKKHKDYREYIQKTVRFVPYLY